MFQSYRSLTSVLLVAAPLLAQPGQYVQQGSKLVVAGAAAQGISVALSFDGNTAIVGENGPIGGAGGALVYVRSAGSWTQQGSGVHIEDGAWCTRSPNNPTGTIVTRDEIATFVGAVPPATLILVDEA